MENKLKLYGFNNLTKSLSFNIYDVCYAKTARSQQEYIAYVDEQYNSERITDIMTHVTEMIGAQVLSMSRQDYDPQGASATFLIADDTMVPAGEARPWLTLTRAMSQCIPTPSSTPIPVSPPSVWI